LPFSSAESPLAARITSSQLRLLICATQAAMSTVGSSFELWQIPAHALPQSVVLFGLHSLPRSQEALQVASHWDVFPGVEPEPEPELEPDEQPVQARAAPSTTASAERILIDRSCTAVTLTSDHPRVR
jgi:hypothetical protein